MACFALSATTLFLIFAPSMAQEDKVCAFPGDQACSSAGEGLSLLQVKADKIKKVEKEAAEKKAAEDAADAAGTEYSDLGSGKCLYQPPTPLVEGPKVLVEGPKVPGPKPKAVNPPHYKYDSAEGHKCKALCDADEDCGGYSVSDYNNCLLWTEKASDLLGGGKPWGDCKCYVKDKAGYKDLGSGKCLYQPPTPLVEGPKVLVEGPKVPGPKPKAETPPHYSYKSAEGHDCKKLCDADKDCGGYSVSDYNNCLLWNEKASELMGGGKPWGDCKCYVKK